MNVIFVSIWLSVLIWNADYFSAVASQYEDNDIYLVLDYSANDSYVDQDNDSSLEVDEEASGFSDVVHRGYEDSSMSNMPVMTEKKMSDSTVIVIACVCTAAATLLVVAIIMCLIYWIRKSNEKSRAKVKSQRVAWEKGYKQITKSENVDV